MPNWPVWFMPNRLQKPFAGDPKTALNVVLFYPNSNAASRERGTCQPKWTRKDTIYSSNKKNRQQAYLEHHNVRCMLLPVRGLQRLPDLTDVVDEQRAVHQHLWIKVFCKRFSVLKKTGVG